MASLFHRSRQRRAERAPLTAGANLNLVPLIDVLTSIVFFSLLTYTGAVMAMLTAYDLILPPAVVSTPDVAPNKGQEQLTLLLAVKILDGNLRVEHSEQGGFRRDIPGITVASLDTLEAVLNQIRTTYPQNADVLVVPSDEVSYEDVVKVLERARLARYTGISLGARSRGTDVAARNR